MKDRLATMQRRQLLLVGKRTSYVVCAVATCDVPPFAHTAHGRGGVDCLMCHSKLRKNVKKVKANKTDERYNPRNATKGKIQ